MQVKSGYYNERRRFPSFELLVYWAIQLAIGLLLLIFDLEQFVPMRELGGILGEIMPAFGTGFIQSSTPTTSKIYLLIWWTAVIPAGMVFMYRWGDGFKPTAAGIKMSYQKLVMLILVLLILGYMCGYLLAFQDYSLNWTDASPKSTIRGQIINYLVGTNVFTLSIWCALSSLILVMCGAGVPLLVRTIFVKLFKE